MNQTKQIDVGFSPCRKLVFVALSWNGPDHVRFYSDYAVAVGRLETWVNAQDDCPIEVRLAAIAKLDQLKADVRDHLEAEAERIEFEEWQSISIWARLHCAAEVGLGLMMAACWVVAVCYLFTWLVGV